MSDQSQNSDLLLADFSIEGFFGLKNLSISRLGRATLLVGRNGVGKTTVLDALRLFASRAVPIEIERLLKRREELLLVELGEGHEMTIPDLMALFFGRSRIGNPEFAIGPKDDLLRIRRCEWEDLSSKERKTLEKTAYNANQEAQFLRVKFQRCTVILARIIPTEILDDTQLSIFSFRSRRPDRLQRIGSADWEQMVHFDSLGPGLPDNSDMARHWDRLALTDKEEILTSALNLILEREVERVAVIGDSKERGFASSHSRRLVVKFPGHPSPVPLKSLGDGVTRMCGVALALANCRGGLLLIDEVENGIHESIQQSFWRMLLTTARKNKSQVFATTHSWDCVSGFARASEELDGIEGALVRLEQDGDDIRTVEYSRKDLTSVAEQGIEVR